MSKGVALASEPAGSDKAIGPPRAGSKVQRTRKRNSLALLSKKHPIYKEVQAKLDWHNRPKPASNKPLAQLLNEKMSDSELADLLVKRSSSNPQILKMLADMRGLKAEGDLPIVVRPIDYRTANDRMEAGESIKVIDTGPLGTEPSVPNTSTPPPPQSHQSSSIDVSDSKTAPENALCTGISQPDHREPITL